jgi:uncharacterized OB-fold protein
LWFTCIYIILGDALAGYEETNPYTIALVKLQEEGPVITAQLNSLGDRPVQIGLPVEMITRKVDASYDLVRTRHNI